MEVRHGYGITGSRVSGPVRVGDPLTLLIYMRSKYGEQDLLLENSCDQPAICVYLQMALTLW